MENNMAGANIAPPKRWILQHVLPPEYRGALRVVKRLNNGIIVEDQTIVVPAVLSETGLGATETVNG